MIHKSQNSHLLITNFIIILFNIDTNTFFLKLYSKYNISNSLNTKTILEISKYKIDIDLFMFIKNDRINVNKFFFINTDSQFSSNAYTVQHEYFPYTTKKLQLGKNKLWFPPCLLYILFFFKIIDCLQYTASNNSQTDKKANSNNRTSDYIMRLLYPHG